MRRHLRAFQTRTALAAADDVCQRRFGFGSGFRILPSHELLSASPVLARACVKSELPRNLLNGHEMLTALFLLPSLPTIPPVIAKSNRYDR
jgi:hypothetical protein